MNLESVFLWGFFATVVSTTLMSAGQGLGLSRMSIPYMVGTLFTPNRERAMVVGFAVHFGAGWGFALFYALIFEAWKVANAVVGAFVGALHGLAVLVVLMPILPNLHPRMASEHRGPEPTRALEPPGFLALNYGRQTPLIALIAHAVYGAILGEFYLMRGG